MDWQHSIWNYHKLALVVSLLIFILLSPPIFNFFKRSTTSMFWVAFVIALIVWSFVFLILHIYTDKYKKHQIVEYD
jgi:uncharacterized membrane-anchored protein YhcB (DUF1043 family)